MKAFIVCASLGIAAVGACPSACAFYHLESAIILKSAEPDWDYLTLDPRRGYLFIGRRGDGAAVFDIKTHKVVRTISNSEEAGAIVLVPEFDRGYTANEDGTTTVFQLSTLKSLGRFKFGADCDSGFYDPATKQIMFTMADSKAVPSLTQRPATLWARLLLTAARSKPARRIARGIYSPRYAIGTRW
jgi:hypothetical protein